MYVVFLFVLIRRSIDGEENGHQERTLRDTSRDFDRMGLGVVNRHCSEPVVQVGLEPGKASVRDLECVLGTGEKDGVASSVKSSQIKYFFVPFKAKRGRRT